MSNDEKPYDNLYKHYPRIVINKIDMSCRCFDSRLTFVYGKRTKVKVS